MSDEELFNAGYAYGAAAYKKDRAWQDFSGPAAYAKNLKIVGYFHFHAEEAPTGEFSAQKLIRWDKKDGWREVPVYCKLSDLRDANP